MFSLVHKYSQSNFLFYVAKQIETHQAIIIII